MLELNFWPSTAMLWPALSVMVASPWQARQSACARRALGANAMARTATPAAVILFRKLDRARFLAARFILPSSFPMRKMIDRDFAWFHTHESAAAGETFWPQRPLFRDALLEATLAVIGVTRGAIQITNPAFSGQLSTIRREAAQVMWVTCRRESS